MSYRPLALVLLLGLGGIVALALVQWRFDLGFFERNPQSIEVALGRRTIVGGGRALLGLVALQGTAATFELGCRDQAERFDLEPGTTSEEFCGVRARFDGTLGAGTAADPTVARVEVWWERHSQ